MSFLPMRVHKSIVIQQLRSHPEDRAQLIPDWPGTIEEYIAELERHPGQYFVGGELQAETVDGRLLRRQIVALQRKHQRLEKRIGALMSERVGIEEELGSLLRQAREHGVRL